MVPHENLCALPSDEVWLRRVALGVGLQKFHTIKVMAADLGKSYSEDHLPTAPW